VLPLQHAEFGTELVVTLYSGWIGQLVDASFARRTHEELLCLIVKKIMLLFENIENKH